METFQEHYDSLKTTLEKHLPGKVMPRVVAAIRYAEE